MDTSVRGRQYPSGEGEEPSPAQPAGNGCLMSETSFRQVVEWAPTAMILVDAAGSVVLMNAQAERVFGYAREELVGQPVELLVPMQFAGAHPDNRRDFLANPQPRPMGTGRDLFARHRDGVEFPVEIGLNPIATDDGVMTLASVVDITERRRAQEKLENALREKTVLLNELHHRVKNNLQIIASLLNLQASHAGDPRLEAMLNESQSRVKAMALTHQLLYERKDYSRVDLGEYLERLIQLLIGSYRTESKRITLRCTHPEAPLYLDLERAIPCGLVANELVTNSFKHAFPNAQSGEIIVDLQALEDQQAVLVVADNGIGLPEGFSLESVTSLGLQLVPLLVDQLGGVLAAEAGQGARFVLRFSTDSSRRISS